MSQQSRRTLAVYSDYVCPFCYLGRASLERYHDEAEDPPAIEWKPFDLRGYKRDPDGEIDHDVDDGKGDDYFEQVEENVQRLKEEYDVEMDLAYSRDVDSWDAQKAALYVKRSHDEATFEAFHEAVFDALWQDGRNIGDEAVLVDVAESVGVDGEEVRDAVDDEGLDRELRQRFDDAHQQGITGIPTFVYEDHAARGAVPPAQLRRLVEGG